MSRILSATVLFLATTSGALVAQSNTGFVVGPRLGWMKYQEETGVKNGPVIAVDATYRISRYLGLGASVGVVRAKTDGNFFPAEMTFRDTTLLFAVEQPLTTIHVAGLVTAELPLGTVRPYVRGGAGLYHVTLDPQVAEGSTGFSELLLVGGVGFNFQVGSTTGIRLEVTDYVYTSFDREQINPVDARFAPTRFPDVIPSQPPFHKTAHNFAATLGFTFTPGAR
ncbi:MAG: porin family protein [Gemmatimonadota bacterium]|nr:porin family protein [Gemmatimonadota bacterium]